LHHYITGVLHNRIAWDVLSQSPAGVADDLKTVLSAAGLAGVGEGDAKTSRTREGGIPLNATEEARPDILVSTLFSAS
jgi:hypothetical protein